MRAILPTSLLAIVAAISLSACSGAANNAADNSATSAATSDNAAASTATSDNSAASSDNSATSAASDNSAASTNAASDNSAASGAAAGPPPVYPGATEGARPAGVASGAPASVKAYSTSDDFAKVTAWYRANLKGAGELPPSGKDKDKDVFLVGKATSGGSIVMIQTAGGKTWIVIGPPQ
jgi:hypothetical protein